MAKDPVKFDEGRIAFRNLQLTPDGQLFTRYLFEQLLDGETLANSDARKQERNVALHDKLCELKKMLEP